MQKILFSIFLIIFSVLLVPHAFADYEDTIVILETPKGKLLIEFFPDVAPNHVENFINLAEDGTYTGTIFHRVIEGFMIQGGDPKSKEPGIPNTQWGTGNPGYTIDAEFNQIKHDRGIVSMARSSDPNSAGSQFFIVHEDAHFLDGAYTVFGRIITPESFETLDRIATMDTIRKVTGEQNLPVSDVPMESSFAMINSVEIVDRSDIPDAGTKTSPTTTHKEPMSASGGKYTNKQFGISFDSPQGWMIQTPVQVDSTTPNIVVAGPKIGSISPALTIKISQSFGLENDIQNFRNTIVPLIEQNVIKIKSEGELNVNGNAGYLILAEANFENQEDEILELGFGTVLVSKYDKLYEIQYMNSLENYDKQNELFRDMLNSFEVTSTALPDGSQNESATMETWNEESPSEGGGCLIATAAFGSEMAPQVQFLREIRDNTVMSTQSGTAFMTGFNQFYYSFSPYVADYERENPVFKEAVKVTLTPLLTSLTLLNYVDVDSEQEMLGYGIGIILLNIGMYFVAPAAVIIAIKNRIKRN